MRRVIVAACLVLPTGASAQELEFNFEQFFVTSQQALQRISEQARPPEAGTPSPQETASELALAQIGTNAVNTINSDKDIGLVEQGFGVWHTDDPRDGPVLEAATQRVWNTMWDVDSVGFIGQTGRNAANLVNSTANLGEINQIFNGRQIVDNRIDTGTLVAALSIDQSGSNYANMIQGDTISLADQAMLDGARQIVSNNVLTGGAVGDIRQDGTNVANIAMAELAIDAANQFIGHNVKQRVWNYIEFDSNTTVSGSIDQIGFNIGNVLVADRIEAVTREFYGKQIVVNEIVLHDPVVPKITQSGSNIANLIVANNIGTVNQISSGYQLVRNSVEDAEGSPISSSNITQTDTNYQGASNVVNMMVLRAQQSGNSSSPQPVLVDQQADFPQTGEGVSGQSQTGNVTVINR